MKLLQISRDVMVWSLLVMMAGLFIGFALEGKVPLQMQIAGHALAMLAAVGLKLGYIVRLEALAIIDRNRPTPAKHGTLNHMGTQETPNG